MNMEAVKRKKHELGRYDLTYEEVLKLIAEAKKGGVDIWFDLITLSYAYGFIRGGNAEQNKRKRG